MADDRAYRIQISFNPENETFLAKAPELDLETTGETRSDAISQLEEEIEARLIAAAEGDALPEPIDEEELETTFEVELAPVLVRDLNYYAHRTGISINDLVSQFITHGIGKLEGRIEAEKKATETSEPQEERQPRRRAGGRRRGRRDGPRRDIDDQANFLEYVRDLERGKGGGRRGR